jgi:hypothetical protein
MILHNFFKENWYSTKIITKSISENPRKILTILILIFLKEHFQESFVNLHSGPKFEKLKLLTRP